MPSPIDMLVAGLGTFARTFKVESSLPESLDALRSDLSHEPAARLALLSAIIRDWSGGRFQPEDPARCRILLDDLRVGHRKVAALAAVSGASWRHLVAVLAAIRSLDRACRDCAIAGGPDAATTARAAADLAPLRIRSKHLVDALTRRYAVDLVDVVRGAVADVGTDSAEGSDDFVAVALEVPSELGSVWLSRADGVRWRDVLRNLVRNAIQATQERWPAAPGARPPVRVVLRRLVRENGVQVEIVDLGVGMDAAQQACLWVSGSGRHGPGRGQGLTETKRTFVEARAALRIVSAAGDGTAITLDFPPRDVAIPALRPWQRPSLQLAALLLVLAAGVALPGVWRADLAKSTQVVRSNAVRGLGERGEVLWDREVGCRILGNDHLAFFGVRDLAAYQDPRNGRLREVLVASASEDGGPGSFTFLDGRGRVVARREIRWKTPRGESSADLGSFWQAPVAWHDGPQRAYVADVRLERRAPESIQVVTAVGPDLGAYHHPGQIKFFACDDFDGDGHEEFLFFGINNDAWQDSLLVDCSRGAWHGCAALLEVPPWDGQAYPGRGWDDQPPARELAYLLIPPLDCGLNVQAQVSVVERQSELTPTGVHLLLRLQDGRVVETDGDLRPLCYTVGDVTAASRLEAAGELPALRVAYFRRGVAEVIELPRKGVRDE